MHFHRYLPTLSHGWCHHQWPFVEDVLNQITPLDLGVKNGFSDPTANRSGETQERHTTDHWEKALREGCHDINQAQTDVFSIEKTNTK